MASANLDLVRSINAAWERGDFSGTDWADPEIVFEFNWELARGKWTGIAGMAEAGSRGWAPGPTSAPRRTSTSRSTTSECSCSAHFSGRGRTSGVALDHVTTKAASLFHVRDGKVTQLVLYPDGEQALADLGLSR